ADFTQHMVPGRHTDGQIYLWIKNGFPGSAMPAWGQRLSEEQIWQLVTYLRTFGQLAPPVTVAPTQPPSAQSADTPLPPLIFARRGDIWRSDGSAADPVRLTHFKGGDIYAEHPTLSPDGTRVAFVLISPPPVTATLPLPRSDLYVMNADGGDLH